MVFQFVKFRDMAMPNFLFKAKSLRYSVLEWYLCEIVRLKLGLFGNGIKIFSEQHLPPHLIVFMLTVCFAGCLWTPSGGAQGENLFAKSFFYLHRLAIAVCARSGPSDPVSPGEMSVANANEDSTRYLQYRFHFVVKGFDSSDTCSTSFLFPSAFWTLVILPSDCPLLSQKKSSDDPPTCMKRVESTKDLGFRSLF